MATTTTFTGKKVHQGMIKSQKTRVGDFIIAFIIFLTMLICLLPMVNVLASSLSSSEHLIRNDVFLWPKGWNFEAYKTILSDSKYTWSLAWTGILTVGCTVLSLVLTVCTAFPLIYKNLRGGKVINFIILFTMYFSAGTIPGYILLNNLKMLNTPWALILPNCISVFNVIVLRSFFYSVPDSLREAAEIDGAGPIRTLVTVYLPLSLPSLATLALFYAVGRWNGFSDALIPKTFKKDPYRILIVADMFQTGFDEPLLHTMYVDKPLYDIGAVQTLSRLNRAYPGKDDTFVLDFANKTSVIEESFSKYYRTTILSGETDPNKLYDLITVMEDYQVYSNNDVERLVDLFLSGAERDRLDPILDACTAVYKQLETDDQIKFKSAAKSFVRTYGFLGAILPYGNVEWEKLSIFLNLLIPKLPSPREDDLSEGILSTIDLSSYRNEAREMISIRLEDQDAEIAPVPAGKTGHIVEPEMDLLSRIISDFNDMFGNINWNDADNVQRQILEIPAMVSRDKKYQNAMRNSDEQSARLESERALQQVIFAIMADNMELFKQFQDNPSFKKWLSDLVFNLTYNPEGKEYVMPGPGEKNVAYDFPTQESLMVAEDPAKNGDKKDED